ncbi:DUF6297 family protein [Brooklawnia cerclae]|uniref:DUF6297 family protein n=1 Tax=Brooklawnia cerclae TaxID=349934 RepID=UPI0031DD90AC
MSGSSKRRRRRSAARPQPSAEQGAVAEVIAVERPEVVWEPERPFADVEEFEAGEADERLLRLLMKDWRKGRATRSVWDMITDSYVTIFSLVVIVAMFASGVMSVQRSTAGCSTAGCTTARGLVPWLLYAGAVLVALTVSRIFGPVIASAAEGFWLLDAPVRRAKLLNRRLWLVLVVAFLAAVLAGGLVVSLIGMATEAVLVWTAAFGLAAAAATAFAARAQSAERTLPLAIAQGIAAAVCTIVLMAMVAVSYGWLQVMVDPVVTEELGIIALAVALVGLIGAVAAARMGLGQTRRARLVSGGDLLSGMQGAAFALDFGLMRDILVERRWVERGFVHPTRGRGTGRQTLIWRDVERLVRSPRSVLVLLVSALVPYALLSLGLGNFTPAIAAIVLMFVMVPFFDSLRVLNRTKGLARAFPLSTSEINGALTTVPAALAIVWAFAAAPAFVVIGQETVGLEQLGVGLAQSFVTAAAGYVAAIRWVSAKSADYSSPMVATGMGALPPGLAFNLVRGFDVIALISLPLIVGWSPLVSIAIAAVCYFVLRSGGINTQDLMERNEEAQKELATMRSGQAKPREKIVVERSRRRTT